MIKPAVTFLITVAALCCARGGDLPAGEAIRWHSAAVGREINARVLFPPDRAMPAGAVVYLMNLAAERIGIEPDESIIRSFLESGHLVLMLDYQRDPAAVSPQINADILKLRSDIAGKTPVLLKQRDIDPNHLYIVCEGFRLKRDVEFARDGDRVLAMDIIYPARPKARLPVLMEITCDNVNRMGSFSLLYCQDTLLEGAPAAGFAAAMVDHPVRPPYKGIDDPMPQSLDLMKAAVAKLRAMREELNLNGNIGAIGFSRGGPFAAMLAGGGDVEAALIHGNRYDYLDLRADDPMLPRFEKAWGPRDENREKWACHGAAHFLTEKAAPMFLNTSDAESAEYRHGLAKFAALLERRGVEYVYVEDADGRGHRVTTDPKTLAMIYAFFEKHLGAERDDSRR